MDHSGFGGVGAVQRGSGGQEVDGELLKLPRWGVQA